MKKTPASSLFVLMLLWLASLAAQGGPTNSVSTEPFDYASQPLLTGTIYAAGSDHKHVLFTFRRVATRSGPTVHVERTFALPNGSPAATESVVYESGQLASYQMKELQAGTWGNIEIKPELKNPARSHITISHGIQGGATKAGTTDDLPKDFLINDNIYPFVVAHWSEITKGSGAKFRFPSLEWERTFGFKLSKVGESMVNGKPVVLIRMEATSLIVSSFMAPLTFSAEKESPHYIVEYLGRTTPKIKVGKAWKPLDADTVFDWK